MAKIKHYYYEGKLEKINESKLLEEYTVFSTFDDFKPYKVENIFTGGGFEVVEVIPSKSPFKDLIIKRQKDDKTRKLMAVKAELLGYNHEYLVEITQEEKEGIRGRFEYIMKKPFAFEIPYIGRTSIFTFKDLYDSYRRLKEPIFFQDWKGNEILEFNKDNYVEVAAYKSCEGNPLPKKYDDNYVIEYEYELELEKSLSGNFYPTIKPNIKNVYLSKDLFKNFEHISKPLNNPKVIDFFDLRKHCLWSKGELYIEKEKAKVLVELQKEHKPLKIKNGGKGYWFEIAGELYHSTSPIYYDWLAELIGVQKFMLEEAKE
ncbi:MAG: hypothetical protein HUJ68_09855 [Clostridia bacterium]|nr:hypothetical protein [Clostridia bacterium]